MTTQTDQSVEWLGTSYKTILNRADCGGAMSILDVISPAGSGPPRHVHDAEDESFFILSGEIELWLAGQTRRIGVGQAAFVPRGVEHTFRVTGDIASRHLVILTPGGFEDFFARMAQETLSIPKDMGQIMAIAAQHNLRFTGPPLAQDAGKREMAQ